MKKSILFITACILFSLNLFAQNSFYLQLNTGYGFHGIKDDLGSPFLEIGTYDFMETPSGYEAQWLKGTLGKGVKVELGAGYMFNKNLGVEMMLGYVKSPKVLYGRQDFSNYFASHEVNTFRLVAKPQLVFRAECGKLKPFARVGTVIPIIGQSNSFVQIDDAAGLLLSDITGIPAETFAALGATTNLNIEAVSKSSFTVGLQGSLGVSYEVGKNILLNAGVFFEALTTPILSTELTRYNLDVDLNGLPFPLPDEFGDLESLPTIDKETNYVKTLTQDSNNPAFNQNTDPTKPLDELSFRTNYNSMGIEVGVIYLFNKDEDAKK